MIYELYERWSHSTSQMEIFPEQLSVYSKYLVYFNDRENGDTCNKSSVVGNYTGAKYHPRKYWSTQQWLTGRT